MDKKDEEQHSMSKPKPLEVVSDGDLTEIKKDPVWKSWLEMIIKPIPDSKGGKGSFQHCINANQDKHNPGGWCKQIERKIEGKKKAKKQTKIDEPKHWWDHSKVGTQGDIDQKTGRPCWEVMTEERERRKREKKKGEKIEELESDYYMDAGGNPQLKEKADYFIEEIRANIIFEDKIAPLLGMIAGRVGQAVLGAGKKMAEGVKQTGKWLVTPQDEEEEY